jgi:choline monooxygenase
MRMFTHQTHLRPLLRAEHYYSDAQHRTELEHLFRPSWFPVGVKSQLARPGSFRTLDLLGTPLLLRNFDGKLRAFLNVCPHRHSRLTNKESGRTQRLRCQYHGWEFDADGRTRKIPDAKAFRPWDRENSCVKSFRIETRGDVIFVSLAEEGASLEDFLAPAAELWEGAFSEPFRFASMWAQEFPCNWKVILENALESYHVPELHAKTFGEMPAEESCAHDLHAGHTAFSMVLRNDVGSTLTNLLTRSLGAPITNKYHHMNIHPHVTLTRLDIYRQIMFLEPTGPESCRYHSIIFTLNGRPWRPVQWLLSRLARTAVVHFSKKVYAEDGSIYAEAQLGTASSSFAGVIGTREERIQYFQKFVLDRCGLSVPADPALPEASRIAR